MLQHFALKFISYFAAVAAVVMGNVSGSGELSSRSRPVIGILSIPTDAASDSVDYSRIDNSYVRWLEGAGAMVVPIYFNESASHVEEQFLTLNGVLFTGGPDKPTDFDRYFETATLLYNLALKLGMPLWGTCLGFQTISDIAAGGQEDILSDYDAYDMELPLHLTIEARATSRLFGPSMPSDIRLLFTDANYTTNWHHYGVSPETFTQQVGPAGFRALSINADKQGALFVSALEHETAPMYAVQFHPEANAHDRDHETVDHSSAAVQAMQYLASFFVQEARSKGLGPGDVGEDTFDNIETYPLEGTKYIFA